MKIVVPFYPIDVKGKEDYFKLAADVTGGEMVSVTGKSNLEIIKKITGEDVHAHGRGFPFPESCGIFAKKSIYTPHFNTIGQTWWTRKARRIVFNRYNKIIALTKYAKNNFIKEGIDSKKIEVLPLPVDFDFFSKNRDGKKFRKKFDLGNEKFVLAVGARGVKNPKVIIDACQKVGIKLVFAGHKNPKDIKKGFEWLLPPKLANLDNVIFTGLLSREEMRGAFSSATIFANSSDYESFGLAVYESAAAGLPMCLPKIGTFDLFNNCALFHNSKNSNELANNIEKYIDDKNLFNKNKKGAKRISKNFNYPIVRKMHEKFYQEAGVI